MSRVRVVRSYDCRCGFRNEIGLGYVDADAPNPWFDPDTVFPCPGPGCDNDAVQLGAILRLPIRELTPQPA